MSWVHATLLFAALWVYELIGSVNEDTCREPEGSRRGPDVPDRVGGKNWSLYVTRTDDPSIYRAIYTRNGSVRYDVEGHGLSETLEKMADSIEP